MSQETRNALVASPNLFFQDESQRSDLLDETKTQTYLVAFLASITEKWAFELTAVNSDHHDDTHLNPTPPYTGTHAHGWSADGWPLASQKAGDYLDAGDTRFQEFLRDCAQTQYLYQIGLAGTAYTEANVTAAGPTVFQDDGADHVHLGTQAA